MSCGLLGNKTWDIDCSDVHLENQTLFIRYYPKTKLVFNQNGCIGTGELSENVLKVTSYGALGPIHREIHFNL